MTSPSPPHTLPDSPPLDVSGETRRSDAKCELMALPNDILQMVADLLQNEDVKNVRLVDKRFKANAVLRIPRVYISPNPKNLEVFNAIAASTEFRGQVKEIVWDDALLLNWDFSDDTDEYDKLGLQAWQRECGAFADDCMDAKADPNYTLHRQLYQEQQEIIATGTDAQALRDALPLFNSLERVTVTPTTYQPRLDCPRYCTPMIRSFPPSFNFPLPMGWASRTDAEQEEPDEQNLSWEEIKGTWHGLCIVLRELARCDRAVLELVCDVNRQLTGIAWQLFQESPESCEDLQNFETICSRGLRRLALAIHVVRGEDMPGLSMLSTSSLQPILEKATKMESFSLHTDANVLLEPEELDDDFGDGIRALEVIPIQRWPQLRHLALSHLYVNSEEIFGFLGQLPATLVSLELVAITAHPDPSWRRIFDKIKDTLGWTGNKPLITFADEHFSMPWMKHWAKESVISSFVDGEGLNPFDEFGACLEEMSTAIFDNPERYD